MARQKKSINVDTGEFPYVLIDGPAESRYLTWVRNHSNYMAERGFLDYFRLVAVLLRGILVNFLTLLPYLLIASLALGFANNYLLDRWLLDGPLYFESFRVTPWILVAFAAHVLLFPVVIRLFKVISHGKALETGSSSSVKSRDIYERTFGGLLIAIVAFAVIETLPILVHFIHKIGNGDTGWTFPTAAGLVAVLVAANKILPMLGGLARKLAVLAVGALGLLIPLLVVLFVVELAVYDKPLKGFLNLNLVLIVLPAVLIIGIVLAMFLGAGSFKSKGYGRLLVRIAGLFVLLIAVFLLLDSIADGYKEGDFLFEYGNFVLILAWAVEIWIFSSLAIDVNLTSINGLYRDRLASAFLVGKNIDDEVDIERDIDLQEICLYEAGSTAPYHLVNVALNLQGSKDIAIRERNSDFFIFSKKFIGSERTGYCRSEDMEHVYPQIDLATAMAISAAAASPNMGRGTNPLMVAFMTLLNVRLGYWTPNPGKLEMALANDKEAELGFEQVFQDELVEIARRREQIYQSKTHRPIGAEKIPSTAHSLAGIGFSGGGIRSATINLGIAQALHKRGVFDHIDYMSTVSGGGYLGSSISTLMRYRTTPFSEIAGTVSVQTSPDHKLVRVTGKDGHCEYRYTGYAELDEKIKDGEEIKAGQPLLRRVGSSGLGRVSLMDRFTWRVRPVALLREMLSMLDEDHKWVNLSDGGHIENLATIELLRRRCKFIIIGDGEADPNLHFDGLATLIRYARIDLGIKIDINLDKIRVDKSKNAVDTGKDNLSVEHHAFGTIAYPADKEKGQKPETGYLLYLKSSFTGDEEEVIMEYRHRNPDFPHESTADQFFDEGQFEAYRSLGQHIAEQALKEAPGTGKLSELESWFKADRIKQAAAPSISPSGSHDH